MKNDFISKIYIRSRSPSPSPSPYVKDIDRKIFTLWRQISQLAPNLYHTHVRVVVN